MSLPALRPSGWPARSTRREAPTARSRTASGRSCPATRPRSSPRPSDLRTASPGWSSSGTEPTGAPTTSTPTTPVVSDDRRTSVAMRRAGEEQWAQALFPQARTSSWSRPRLACGYIGGFVLVLVLALARQSGVPATKTLWAKDGAIFYSQAVAHTVLHTLAASYNGYGQLVPRLAVQLTRVAPLRDVPTAVALAGAVGLALLSCLVFHLARGHIASPGLRALLVGAMVLLPLGVVEMLDNLVNLPWWIFFVAFWALLWRPSTGGGRLVAGLVCLLAAASEPLVGLLLPLGAVRAAALRH